MNKYLNEAIIGNKNMLATFTEKGELQRLYFPCKDHKQYIDFFHTGVKINTSDLIYLHDDINNVYKQYYDTDTNVLNTEVVNTYFNLQMLQTDFILIKENVLVKKYLFINESTIDLDTKFYVHSGLLTDQNNMVGSKIVEGGMLQYAHDFSVSTFAKGYEIEKHQINGSKNTIKRGEIQDKDYIGMSADCSISYNLGVIKPGEKKEICICILVGENTNISDLEDEIERIKRIDFAKEYASVKSYWIKYVKTHNGLNLKEPQNSYDEKIYEIYKRSILLFPLLTNQETGGVIASPEIDEERTRCGRYAYCWPRDAVFITKAMDILNMDKETEKFYKIFCKKTQSKNGMWEQRFYTDCKLAPAWGYQVDETASVVYGVYKHYQHTKNKRFLKETLTMCEKAIKYLKKYTEDIVEEKNKMHVSYDLWEMCEGTHLYSLAAIYAAFETMEKIYDKIYDEYEENRIKQEKISKERKEYQELKLKIKNYIAEKLYDKERKTYVRNTQDKKLDISIIGAVTPFKLYTPKEKKITNTIENIDLSLRTYTGGYKRFEEDNYMNGNPWTIATLWMAEYHIQKGERNKAIEELNYVVKSANQHGLLPEQVNNEKMKPAWVIGLGWAHAMFIQTIKKLY